MTFYILLNHITALYLSLNLLTTLTFDSEITSYLYGGGKDDLFITVTNNNKTLAIKPKLKGALSNLLVLTKDRKYYFDLKIEDPAHQFIEVKNGVINHNLTKKIKTPDYEIFEAEMSLLFVNLSKLEIDVNGQKIRDKTYLSKGVPILLNGSRILN